MNTHASRLLAAAFGVAVLAAGTFSTAQSAPANHMAPRRRPVGAKPACPAPQPQTPANLPPAKGCAQALYTLRYVDLQPGTGDDAKDTGYYTVHYTGWLASNGTKFDSSVDRGEPITFPIGQHRVIPGWDTGFAGMKVGGKRRLYIPYQLAYGDRGRPPVIPAKSDLIFDIELVSQSDSPAPPKPPAPAAPAADSAPKAMPGDAPAGSAAPAQK